MSTDTKSIDVITHYFPPLGGPGANRALAQAKYFHQAGYRVRVWAPTIDSADPFFQSGGDWPKAIDVRRVPLFDLAKFGRKTVQSTQKEAFPQTTYSRSLQIRELLRLPDHKRLWNRKVIKEICKIGPSQTILTTSPYNSTHLIGCALKKKYPHLFWVAEFRDAWVEKTRSLPTRFHEVYNRWLENQVLDAADLLVYVYDPYMEELGNSLVEHTDKVVLNPNGYDKERIAQLELKDSDTLDDPLRFVFVGTFWDRCWPPGLLEAWDELRGKASRGLEMHLYGRIEPAVLSRLQTYLAFCEEPTIFMHGMLPADEALTQVAAADVLCIFTTSEPNMVTYKIFESMAVRRPILYFGLPTSPGAELLRQSGAMSAPIKEHSEAGVREAFLAILEAIERADLKDYIPQNPPERTDTESRVVDLIKEIESRQLHS